MTCYHPLDAWHSGGLTASGKQEIVFQKSQSKTGIQIKLPCGQCIGCRLDKTREWAIRCVHEASLHTENSFITLTYNDENLPQNGTLIKKHYQDFMKRLRFEYRPKTIRFYQCGEYGENLKRPHYHACLFGIDFEDKILFSEREGIKIYTSDKLAKIWGKGFNTIGEVTFQSAAYCARYIMKKITGKKAAEHYETVDPITGEIINLQPEYTTMSRRPGVGKGWYDKYSSDIYPSDFITHQGKIIKPPKYYDAQYEINNAQTLELLKIERKSNSKKYRKDNTPARLASREKVKKAQFNQLKRGLDNAT